MADLNGSTVGSIRILESLGVGGLGEVYLGEDQRLRRLVAVKAIRRDDGRSLQAKARLLREAQVLSRLEHPNICRVYDYIEGDDTDFLVLELVTGTSLGQAIAAGLDEGLEARISTQVARALAAAHAMSIVHGDLRPESVMLTSEGEVKVVDFGLASSRDTQTGEAEGARLTQPVATPAADEGTGGDPNAVGAPRHLSPEQARGEPATAASDMFAFGLLLQEMYTGLPPYPEDIDAAALLQRIRNAVTRRVEGLDPDLTDLINSLTSRVATERPAAEAALERLCWIRDRPKRRARRLLVTGVAASLIIAAVASTGGLLHARRSLARSRVAEAEAGAVNAFLRRMLSNPDADPDGRELRVVEVLDRASSEVGSSFSEHPLQRASVLHTLGVTYQALGLYEPAIGHMSEAVELSRIHLGTDARQTLASMNTLANLHRKLGHLDEAEALHRETLATARRALGEDDLETIRSMGNLANVLYSKGRKAEALDLTREVWERKQRVLGEEHRETMATAGNLAIMLRAAGEVEEAEALLRSTLAVERRVLGDEHPLTLAALGSLSNVLLQQHRHDEALELARETLETRRRILGDEHPETLIAQGNLAVILLEAGRLAEAEPIARDTWATVRRVRGEDHIHTMAATESLAAILEEQGRLDEATELLAECLAIRRRVQGESHPDTLFNAGRLAAVMAALGQRAEAVSLVEESLASARTALGERHRVSSYLESLLERLQADDG